MTADYKGLDRRTVLGGLGTLVATGPAALAASPPLPSAPVDDQHHRCRRRAWR